VIARISLKAALLALTGGDTALEAVEERRCLYPPLGCGRNLTPRVFDTPAIAREYLNEWRITGLCTDCQSSPEPEGT